MMRQLTVWNLGRMTYGDALKIQTLVANRVKELMNKNKSPLGILMLVEHNPVYTIGLRTKPYSHQDQEKLLKLGAEFYKTNRGGLITFHGPGQLVAYPILNLKQFRPSVKWYVETIEQVVIDLCKHFGVEAGTSPHTGVWVKDNKICAIGIHGSRYVTTHGFALNCNVDLEWFSHIIPCGVEGKGVTSLSRELQEIVTLQYVTPNLLKCFSKRFNCGVDSVIETTDIDTVLKLL